MRGQLSDHIGTELGARENLDEVPVKIEMINSDIAPESMVNKVSPVRNSHEYASLDNRDKQLLNIDSEPHLVQEPNGQFQIGGLLSAQDEAQFGDNLLKDTESRATFESSVQKNQTFIQSEVDPEAQGPKEQSQDTINIQSHNNLQKEKEAAQKSGRTSIVVQQTLGVSSGSVTQLDSQSGELGNVLRDQSRLLTGDTLAANQQPKAQSL